MSAFKPERASKDGAHCCCWYNNEHLRSVHSSLPCLNMLSDSGMHACLQAPAADLTSLIAWFRDCSDADHSARLAFPPSLSKAQRAHIHTLVTSVGLGCLESVSEGVGEERFIAIVRSGAKPCQVDQDINAEHAPQNADLWTAGNVHCRMRYQRQRRTRLIGCTYGRGREA